jgi:hypothetical protein
MNIINCDCMQSYIKTIFFFKVQFMLTFVVCFDSLVIRVALCKSVITDDISLVQAILHHIKIASKNVFKYTILYC